MNNRHFRITLNIDAEICEVRSDDRSHLLPIDIDVTWDASNPSGTFCLAPRQKYPKLITGSGTGQVIDLQVLSRTFDTVVLLRFWLNGSNLTFPNVASEAMGIHVGETCPTGPCNENKGIFRLTHVAGNELTLRIERADGQEYRFALFLHKAGQPQPISFDPHIINK